MLDFRLGAVDLHDDAFQVLGFLHEHGVVDGGADVVGCHVETVKGLGRGQGAGFEAESFGVLDRCCGRVGGGGGGTQAHEERSHAEQGAEEGFNVLRMHFWEFMLGFFFFFDFIGVKKRL